MNMRIKRFDIVMVNFGSDVLAGEQGGIRPAVIVQNNCGNTYGCTTLVMPLTTRLKKIYQPTHTIIYRDNDNNLSYNSMVLGECLRQISEQRILKYVGSIKDIDTKKEIKRVYDANFGKDVE